MLFIESRSVKRFNINLKLCVLVLACCVNYQSEIGNLVSWGNAFAFEIEGIIALQYKDIFYSIYEHDNINKWEKDRDVVFH